MTKEKAKYQPYFDKFRGMVPYLDIPKKEWSYIKRTFTKSDVRKSLANVLLDYPLPYSDISLLDARKAFNKLKGIHQFDILTEGEWFARGSKVYSNPITIDGTQKYFRKLNAGNDASNYFQQENRWTVDGSAPGPQTSWSTEDQIYSVLGSAYSMKVPKLDKQTLKMLIGLRKYICAQFKPNVAKVIYDMYKAENILDFSAGWGDRLAGFYASEYGKFYLGIDPKKENHPLYKKQAEFYAKQLGLFDIPKRSKFVMEPAEDFDYKGYDEFFDLVFTSPPYFTTEKYSYDTTQSWVRYGEIDFWNEMFLHKALGKIWKTIKPGGYLMVNISDVQSGSAKGDLWLKICDPMIEFLIKTFDDAQYIGCYGMEMAARPNNPGSGTAKEIDRETGEDVGEKIGVFAEPIWVIRKEIV